MTHILLICSVGGTPEPVVASFRHWNPEKVYFIVSEKTRPIVEKVMRDLNASTGEEFPRGAVDFINIADPEALVGVVSSIRALTRVVNEWRARGDEFRVAADFTGGTKCMSAALALVARRWPCEFSYVGGSRRNKDGVGIVEAGSEVVKSWGNPWDLLGYQAAEDAVTVFNQGGYAAAAAQIAGSMKSVENEAVKRTLSALCATINAFAAWDRFDHAVASTQFSEALRFSNDLSASFAHADDLLEAIGGYRDLCVKLKESDGPTWLWVDDLIDNAMRRAREQRFDDAVARMYRACEAIAQVRLRERFQIENTGCVPVEKLPPNLRAAWASRTLDGCVRIALQDAFRLLDCWEDEYGKRFNKLGLAEPKKSLLGARNRSILAHGFQPVSKSVYDQLQRSVCTLRGEEHVPSVRWHLPAVR